MKYVKTISILLILLACHLTVSANIPASERKALIDLYNSTNGDSWTRHYGKSSPDYNGWKGGTIYTDGFTLPGTEDNWWGVFTDEANTTVLMLDLSENNLRGALPSSLGNLSNLEYLRLDYNQLTGGIPSSLGNLRKLKVLSVGSNPLTGSIPASLGNLGNLKFLNLAYSSLTGSIPPSFSNLRNLESLYLQFNGLTGSIPAEVGNLSKLKYLYLESNQLTGSIPSSLGNLGNLLYLNLESNKLMGSVPAELGNLSNLIYFWLGDNQLTGSIPASLGNLNKLSDLDLSSNRLTGSIPPRIGNLPWLDLQDNQLTGSIPKEFGDLGKICGLHLSSNRLTGRIPAELGKLSTLYNLDLSSNQLTGSIPAELGNLSNLEYLHLNSNQLTGNIPAELGNLSNLYDLKLNSNQLSGEIPTSLTNLTKLYTPFRDTNIGYNALHTSDPGLVAFLNLKDPDWAATQTIAPTEVSATPGRSSATLTWAPTAYTGDTGGYRVYAGTVSGGPYTFYAQTANKNATSLSVSGLNSGVPFYFVVQTRTDAHTGDADDNKNNRNIVDSEYSAETTATPLISPAFTITSPNGGESWIGGSVHNITWATTDTVAAVKLEYSTDGGTAWTTIVASMTNTNTYAWTVPSLASANCLVRVSEASTGSPSDVSNAVFWITGDLPMIVLSKNGMTFGAERNGIFTPAESVIVSNAGKGTLNWTAVSSSAWLSVSPGSGTNTGVLTIGVVQTNLTAGTYQGTITVSDPNAFNSPKVINVSYRVNASGSDSPPFGEFATPQGGTTVASSVPVTGWALDDIGMKSVKIYRGTNVSDRIYIGEAMFVEGARPDVKTAYPTYPQNTKAGWGYILLTNFLPNGGNGTFTLLAYAKDTGDHEVLLGSKAITCDNAHAVKPFGAIDTPVQGGTASGAAYVNFGWALTPQPNSIASNGTTIWVYVDGVALGHPAYNNYRKDIADLFPGYANSNAAVGYYYLDTTGYADGVHTIAWSVSDSGGNSDGIGSRYFTIQNAGGGSSQEERTAKTKAVDSLQDTGTRSEAEIASLPDDGRTPVYTKRGFGDDQPAETVFPEADGSIRIEMPEVSRVAVYLNSEDAGETVENAAVRGRRILNKSGSAVARFKGFELVEGELRPLPIGASFDARNGVLFWQPGPGFLGEYQFVIVDSGTMTRRTIKITIVQDRDSSK